MVLRVVVDGFTQVGISVYSIVANWLLCYIHKAARDCLFVSMCWSAASQ
jgi:hypothetical protein